VSQHELSFEVLFQRAIKQWPAEIDLSVLDPLKESDAKRSLGRIADSLVEQWEGVLIQGIHSAIHIVLHRVIPSCVAIKTSYLRKEAVRTVFEQRLAKSRMSETLNWSEDDKKVAAAYFVANRTAGPSD